jgi:hypothetical protein
MKQSQYKQETAAVKMKMIESAAISAIERKPICRRES